MQVAVIISMFLFSLSMSISPGHVNMVVFSSSVNQGFIKTLPFISGATIGFTLLLAFFGFGFSKIINIYPIAFTVLELFGALFIIYMGYKLISAKPKIEIHNNISLPSFIDGFFLQWLNPKAWIACASGVALFSIPNTNIPLIIFIIIYFIVCYLSLAMWGILGQKLSVILIHSTRMRIFNLLMGGTLIVLSIYMILKIIFN